MGPDNNHIEQVKLDAHIATLRHFRDDALDNGYDPLVSFEETDEIVRAQLGVKAAEEAPGAVKRVAAKSAPKAPVKAAEEASAA